jgi:hypothetical protein
MEAEIPVRGGCREVRDGKVADRSQALARSLQLQISILIEQTHGEPDLPAGETHHTCQQDCQPPSRGNFPQKPTLHPSSIGPAPSAWLQGSVMVRSQGGGARGFSESSQLEIAAMDRSASGLFSFFGDEA